MGMKGDLRKIEQRAGCTIHIASQADLGTNSLTRRVTLTGEEQRCLAAKMEMEMMIQDDDPEQVGENAVVLLC